MDSLFLWELRRGRLFGGLTLRARHHALEAALDDGFRIAHDARHQFGAGRNVVDQALDLAGRPDASSASPDA